MCGRYTQTADLKTLKERFGIRGAAPALGPRYNIAPGQEAAVVLPGRSLELMRWGLGGRLINARVETRRTFASRRCLIPADGFYEWSRSPKLPYRFVLRSRGLFAFAGIWGSRSFAILTTEAGPIVRPIHPRMPVILAREAEEEWLDLSADARRLAGLLSPCGRLACYPVSDRVNSTKNDDEGCVERRREQQLEL